MTRPCAEPNCDRPVRANDLCAGHNARVVTASTKTGPLATAALLTDEPHMPCPADLLCLADWCAENDARAIVRLLWPHLLEASLAGIEPFTLVGLSGDDE